MFSKITIISIGKAAKEFKDLEDHYIKMIKSKIDLQIFKPSPFKDKESKIEKESKIMAERVEKFDYLICLDDKGGQYTSTEFSKKIDNLSRINKSIAFIVGGSYGISDKLKQKANMVLSLSKMTSTHNLIRILLLEQIYRAEEIKKGGKYNK